MKLVDRIQKDRYKRVGKYVLDRWIFQAAFLLMLAWICFIAYSYDFNLNYFYCPSNADGSIQGHEVMLRDFDISTAVKDGYCRNPFYKDTWENQEYLPPGEYGNKPGPLFNSAGFVALACFMLAFLFNHVWHNKKFKLAEKVTAAINNIDEGKK